MYYDQQTFILPETQLFLDKKMNLINLFNNAINCFWVFLNEQLVKMGRDGIKYNWMMLLKHKSLHYIQSFC